MWILGDIKRKIYTTTFVSNDLDDLSKEINKFLDYICNNDIILKEKLLQFIAGVSPLAEDKKLYVILNIKGLSGNKDIFYFSKWLLDLMEYRKDDKNVIFEDEDTFFIKDKTINPRYEKETIMLKDDMMLYINLGLKCIYLNNNDSFFWKNYLKVKRKTLGF